MVNTDISQKLCKHYHSISLLLQFWDVYVVNLSQLQHMMVMTGYPDFLLKPELIDEEYAVRRS